MSGLRDHLQGGCTTVCQCWRVERRDGVSTGFTDHDVALNVDGFNYEPQSGFSQSEVRLSLGMGIDKLDIEGALSSDRLAEDDIAAGLFDGARVTTLLVNWRNPQQAETIRTALIGKIVRADGRFIAELESVMASLDRPNGRFLRRVCDAELGDARCKVDLDAGGFNGAGTVLAHDAANAVLVSGLDGFANRWFALGHATWMSGALDGQEYAVLDHRIGTDGVLLVLPPEMRLPEVGDTFTIVAGCDRLFATCKAKFGNAENFRGFPHLPGNDAAYGYVTDGGVFDGGALVP
jgi:uncharacterized phage protein (TIGR02218 family)